MPTAYWLRAGYDAAHLSGAEWPPYPPGVAPRLPLAGGVVQRRGSGRGDGDRLGLEDERIQHLSGATTPAGVAREQLLRMIRDAGKVPVERDALYNVVEVFA